MLTHLNIQNFTLVDNLDLDLKPGMTVITGETGAGKSIMLGALALTLGDRAEADRVRTGHTNIANFRY
jgi:DNA repair protein RecN (Recombination protein N)